MKTSNPDQPMNRPDTHTERKLYSDIKERARHMRRHPTQAENLLWQRLRKRQIHGFRFRRQHAIGPYIVDFFCFEAGLVIEVDGEIHHKSSQAEYDEERQDHLESLGLYVLRFTNAQVINCASAVVEAIGDWLVQYSPSRTMQSGRK